MIRWVQGVRRRVLYGFVIVACVVLVAPRQSPAQGLGIALFERYLDALRQQIGIPGLSAAIVHDSRIVWERGFGFSDVARAVPARPDTPYPIAGLSQTLAVTVMLQCMERGSFVIDDRLRRWTDALPEAGATMLEVLAHVSDLSRGRTFYYDPGRFAVLTSVADWCRGQPYSRTLADAVFGRLGMADSVPGDALVRADAADREWFDARTLGRYEAVIGRMARPYLASRREVPVAGTYAPTTLDASTGVVSTVRDLARFDAALDDFVLLDRNTLDKAWRQVRIDTGATPTGFGWFVQTSNGQRLVWHFGVMPGGYSSLLLKVPDRRLTLIMLANSDGLSAPFGLENGDVTTSIFARLFLRLMS
jgi:CubicO group peptidase (beta-lactamase class C family)